MSSRVYFITTPVWSFFYIDSRPMVLIFGLGLPTMYNSVPTAAILIIRHFRYLCKYLKFFYFILLLFHWKCLISSCFKIQMLLLCHMLKMLRFMLVNATFVTRIIHNSFPSVRSIGRYFHNVGSENVLKENV